MALAEEIGKEGKGEDAAARDPAGLAFHEVPQVWRRSTGIAEGVAECVSGRVCVHVCMCLCICLCAYMCERDGWYSWEGTAKLPRKIQVSLACSIDIPKWNRVQLLEQAALSSVFYSSIWSLLLKSREHPMICCNLNMSASSYNSRLGAVTEVRDS